MYHQILYKALAIVLVVTMFFVFLVSIIFAENKRNYGKRQL